MPDLQGLCFFPGILQVVSATFTRAHGISPDVCTIECAPQVNPISEAGPLVFTFGPVEMIFPDCKADLGTARRNSDGLIWSIQILTRKWKWAFGDPISGEYNRLDAGGDIIENTTNGLPSSQKSATDLANLLFQFMGEDGDASQLPGDAFPYVMWENDNPAAALADLAEDLGFHVVMGLDDVVRLLPIGVGSDLPFLQTIMENSLQLDSPEPPDIIRVTGAPTVLQARLLLQAVGRDVDGTVVPIDKLTYTPSGGWDAETNLFGSITDETQRKLALTSIFRWYQVLVDNNQNTLNTPNDVSNVIDLSQILPIRSHLVQTYLDDNIERPLPANVWGVFWVGNIGTPLNSNQTRTISGATFSDSLNSGTNFPYKGPFNVIEDRGIVVFDSPMRVWDSTANLFRRCTQLYLECSFLVHWQTDWSYARYEYDFPFPGESFGAGVEVVKKPDDLQKKQFLQYDSTGNPQGWQDLTLTADLDQDALRDAIAAASKYQLPDTENVTYAGLIPIDLDGAIQQITLNVGLAGATTTASRNTETHPWYPPHHVRRNRERLRATERKLAALIPKLRQRTNDNYSRSGGGWSAGDAWH